MTVRLKSRTSSEVRERIQALGGVHLTGLEFSGAGSCVAMIGFRKSTWAYGSGFWLIVTSEGEHWIVRAGTGEDEQAHQKQVLALIVDLRLAPATKVPFTRKTQFNANFCFARIQDPDWGMAYAGDQTS